MQHLKYTFALRGGGVMLRLLLLLMLLLRSLPLLGLLDPLRLLVLPLRRSDRGVCDLERSGERDRGETLRRGDGAGESRAEVGLLERLGDGEAMLSRFDASTKLRLCWLGRNGLSCSGCLVCAWS
jgi:hypothetical protein